MRLYVEYGDSSRAVAVSIDDTNARIGDLATALSLDSGSGLFVDGILRAPALAISQADLVNGSHIATRQFETQMPPDAMHTWIGVINGPDTGAVHRVPQEGRISIGREGGNDLSIENSTVSETHAAIEVGAGGEHLLEDLDSHNGTWIESNAVSGQARLSANQRIRLGSSSITVRPVDCNDRPRGSSAEHADASGRILVNRPPRHPVCARPEAVTLPGPVEHRVNPTITVVSLLVPVVFAAVMVMALGSWRYALFGLLSPMMAIGNWMAGRRRVGRARKTDMVTHRAELERLRGELAEAARIERMRRTSIAPDILEVRRRIELPSSRLWERRHGAGDAMTVRAGIGTEKWDVPIAAAPSEVIADDVAAVVEGSRTLDDIEIMLDFRAGPIGLVGAHRRSLEVARSLMLQLATHHGPADLRIAVLTTPDRLSEWEWAHWLPHTMDGAGGACILLGDASSSLASAFLDDLDAKSSGSALQPGWLFVVDDVSLVHGRSTAVRRIIERTDQRIFGLVMADTADQLPASVVDILDIDAADGTFARTTPSRTSGTTSGIADALSFAVASGLARSLAWFDDPERGQIWASLPQRLGPEELFGDLDDVADARARWREHRSGATLCTELGMSDVGPVMIDLVADGPHALVAGTTGSGKSELLRTLIVGLARNHDPDHLVFALVDYKGGSAFDACVDLPHVVGLVTDLDEHGAERALRSLESELRRRESQLREVGAKDIIEYHAGSHGQSLPRLVVVIDEFATLRAELPTFVPSVVGIAQRGRSLGVHLVLATQRPSGAVDANIRANTNLRIALRVQDANDSVDVIGSTVAADIDRRAPGRAFIRRGEGDLVAVQTGYVSGLVERSGAAVRIAEPTLGTGEPPRFDEAEPEDGVTGLSVLSQTLVAAAGRYEAPVQLWLDPLPERVGEEQREVVRALPSIDEAPVALALVDDPANQRRVMWGWDPARGHLGVWGVLGSGATTTIRSVAVELARSALGRDVWMFGCDHAAGGLADIEQLAHVGCCLDAREHARHARLLSYLDSELERRRALSADSSAALPLIVLAIDGIAGFCEVVGLVPGSSVADVFERLVRDGPAVGIVMVVAGLRLGDAPRPFRNNVRQHVILEQGDVHEYAAFGVRASEVPDFVAGRALVRPDWRLGQVATWEVDDALLPALPGELPPAIDALATSIPRSVLPAARFEPHLSIPVGIAELSREPASVVVRVGEHITISGPPGSGRTSALCLIARQVRSSDPEAVLVGIATDPAAALFDASVFDAGGVLADLEHVLRMIDADERRWVIVVDDADRIDLDDGPLLDLARGARSNVTLVVGVRSSVARQSYGHWTRFVRASGVGVILQPDNAVDGELFALRLPRDERLPNVAGRGYLVMAGRADVVQLAHDPGV